MKKRLIAITMCMILALAMCACGSSSAPASASSAKSEAPAAAASSAKSEAPAAAESSAAEAEEPEAEAPAAEPAANAVTLVCGDGFNLNQNGAEMLDAWAAAVQEATGGEVVIEMHHASVLGTSQEIAESVMAGDIDFTCVSASNVYGSYYPAASILNAFFLFESYDHLKAYQATENYANLMAGLEDACNIRVLSGIYNGVRHFLTKTDVNSLADLSGMKLRVAQEEMPMAVVTALGAAPTPIAISEVYTSLQNGTVDGLENAVSTIVSNNFYEVCPYLILTAHQFNTFEIVMSQNVESKVSPEQLQIIKDCAATVCAEYDTKGQERELEDYKVLEENMTIKDIDLTEFREKCEGVYDQYADVWPEGEVEFIKSLAG